MGKQQITCMEQTADQKRTSAVADEVEATAEPEAKRRRTEQSSEWATVIQSLQSTVNGLQATLSTAMTKSTSDLGASVQMMAQMNSLMEEYLVRSLLVETTVQSTSTTGSVLLGFRLRNSCKFPLGGLRLALQTRSHQSAAAPIDITSKVLFNFPGEPFKLDAGENLSGTAEYKPAALEPLQMITTLSFASPGTGERLSSSHRQSIRLLDLCGKPSKLNDHTTAAAASASGVQIGLEFLRQWLVVDAADPFPFLGKYEMMDGHVLLHIGPREIGNAEQSGVHASFEAVQPRENDKFMTLGEELLAKSM